MQNMKTTMAGSFFGVFGLDGAYQAYTNHQVGLAVALGMMAVGGFLKGLFAKDA